MKKKKASYELFSWICQYLIDQRLHQGLCSFFTQELLGIKQEELVQTVHGELQQ